MSEFAQKVGDVEIAVLSGMDLSCPMPLNRHSQTPPTEDTEGCGVLRHAGSILLFP